MTYSREMRFSFLLLLLLLRGTRVEVRGKEMWREKKMRLREKGNEEARCKMEYPRTAFHDRM